MTKRRGVKNSVLHDTPLNAMLRTWDRNPARIHRSRSIRALFSAAAVSPGAAGAADAAAAEAVAVAAAAGGGIFAARPCMCAAARCALPRNMDAAAALRLVPRPCTLPLPAMPRPATGPPAPPRPPAGPMAAAVAVAVPGAVAGPAPAPAAAPPRPSFSATRICT